MSDQEIRRARLLTTLKWVGVEPRDDSFVCAEWIAKGDAAQVNTLDAVVHCMCEAKYLHEYANFQLGYQMALGVLKHHGKKYPQKQWFQVVRQCVLLTSGNGQMPTFWPWLYGITPEVWKQAYDRTQQISNP